MWKPASLRARLYFMLGGMLSITLGGGLISTWHTLVLEKYLTAVVDTDIPAMQAAQELKTTIAMQKGYVTYYLLEGDSRWLDELSQYHRVFEVQLARARSLVETDEERKLLNDIEATYVRYHLGREEVIGLYKQEQREKGLELQKKVRTQFFRILELCDQFIKINQDRVTKGREASKQWTRTVNELAFAGLAGALLLGIFLAYTLVRNVLEPIRQFAFETGEPRDGYAVQDEVKALGKRLHLLLEDVEQTRGKLEWSREHLFQAEKWAQVGKLAAGVAHSIRNPLTSVKMRLFSLQRHLDLTPDQKEDFEVISEEIRHVDTIVNNFLDFSRPPKLRMEMASLSDVVDMALQLLRHRLESAHITVEVRRKTKLPLTRLDPGQLKEVLVNLLINASEAMINGGTILITEEMMMAEGNVPVVVVRVTDTGPGVPEAIQAKLFQPFFTTKAEGTGLGLSIATRIVEEHGGWLDLESEEGQGATFVITLPARENITCGASLL